MSVFSSYEIFQFETNVLLPQENFGYFQNRILRIEKFRNDTLKTGDFNLVKLILSPVDFKQPMASQFATSVLETAEFLLSNGIFSEQEIA